MALKIVASILVVFLVIIGFFSISAYGSSMLIFFWVNLLKQLFEDVNRYLMEILQKPHQIEMLKDLYTLNLKSHDMKAKKDLKGGNKIINSITLSSVCAQYS